MTTKTTCLVSTLSLTPRFSEVLAESTTTTASAVYSFTNKKPLKRSGLSQASITPSNERVDAKVVIVVTIVTG